MEPDKSVFMGELDYSRTLETGEAYRCHVTANRVLITDVELVPFSLLLAQIHKTCAALKQRNDALEELETLRKDAAVGRRVRELTRGIGSQGWANVHAHHLQKWDKEFEEKAHEVHDDV